MENNAPNSSQSNTTKIITGVFLFCYFGFIIIPEWSRPFSGIFLLWLFILPFVIVALIITGIRGGIGLWREKTQKALPNPKNKYFVWLASLAIAWFIISIPLANSTYYSYSHKKFDSETWKNAEWNDGDLFQLSTRERMLDDLLENTISGQTKIEVLKLLGQPDERRSDEGQETLFYYTGWNIMEPKCLFITFDEQDIVKEYDMTVCG